MSKIDVTEQLTPKQKACLSCLECCRWLRFDCSLRDRDQLEEMVEWYQMRDCRVKVFPQKNYYIMCVLVPQTCKWLTPTGCSIYKHRPDACARYDGTKDVMMEDICRWRKLKEV